MICPGCDEDHVCDQVDPRGFEEKLCAACAETVIADAKEELAEFQRSWPAGRDPRRDEDDGRGDEDHPDSGWVAAFNREQQGES